IHVDAIHIWAVSAHSLLKQEWHKHFLTGTKPGHVQGQLDRIDSPTYEKTPECPFLSSCGFKSNLEIIRHTLKDFQ
ncbi:hypothetical protein, partial [Acetobacter cerevisiae]